MSDLYNAIERTNANGGGTEYGNTKEGGGGGGSSSADNVSYDNTDSGLVADNVQDAIDEVQDEVTELNSNLIPIDVSNNVSPGTAVSSVSTKKVIRVGNVVNVSLIFSTSSVIQYNTDSPIFTGLPKCPNGWSRNDNCILGYEYSTIHHSYGFTVDENGNLFPKSLNSISIGSYVMGATYICGD